MDAQKPDNDARLSRSPAIRGKTFPLNVSFLTLRGRFQGTMLLKDGGSGRLSGEFRFDTGTAAGKAFLDMLGVFAEFETNLRLERQLEGISAAKARGVYKGRRPKIDAGEVRRLRDDEKLGPAAIARRLGIGRASVYRLLGKETGRTNRTPDADQA